MLLLPDLVFGRTELNVISNKNWSVRILMDLTAKVCLGVQMSSVTNVIVIEYIVGGMTLNLL